MLTTTTRTPACRPRKVRIARLLTLYITPVFYIHMERFGWWISPGARREKTPVVPDGAAGR